MTITFTVDRPISLNRMYMPRGGRVRGPGLCLTSEGAAFKERAKQAALEARLRSKTWPVNPYRVLKAEISLQLYNTKMDTDGPRKAIRDSCEGVLYDKDRWVRDAPADFPIMDELGPRVVVTVRILELATEQQGELIRARVTAERAKRAVRQRKTPAA